MDLEAKTVFLGLGGRGNLCKGGWDPIVTPPLAKEGVLGVGGTMPLRAERGAAERACTCVYVRNVAPPAAAECTLGKNVNNQHIVHTSAASGEGAGGSRGLSLAGWPGGGGAGTTRKRGGHFGGAPQLSSPQLSRETEKRRGGVTLNFFCLKALNCSPFCCLGSGTPAGVFVPYLSTEMLLVISHPHFIQL